MAVCRFPDLRLPVPGGHVPSPTPGAGRRGPGAAPGHLLVP